MKHRGYLLASIFLCAVLFCFARVGGADDYVDDYQPSNPDQWFVCSHYWTHRIPADFGASSAEIELRIKVYTFNEYGILDLFCSNTNTFDWGSCTTAPNKTGFIRRITRSDCPNSDTIYTISATLDSTQRSWLNDDGVLYVGLIGETCYWPGWCAQFQLRSSALTASGGVLSPSISRSPISLSTSCLLGTDAPNQSFDVWNSGGGTLNYSISDNVDWLSCTPMSGTSAGEHDTISVIYSTSELPPELYSGTITISASGAGNSPQTIPVSLMVTAPEPDVSISPTSFQTLEIEDSFDSPGSGPAGLAFDGTYLWHADNLADMIYKLDLSGNILASFDSPGSAPQGLAVDHTYLWHADAMDERIYLLDMAGTIIDFFDSPGFESTGLTFDGTYLWNADAIDDKIYRLDPFGTIMDFFDSPGLAPGGLAFDGLYLWNSNNTDGKIYKLDTRGNIIDSFNSPGSSPIGLTFDGTYLWHADRTDDRIYKLLEVPGSVDLGSSTTRVFTITNMGTADLELGILSITGEDASEFSIYNDNCSGKTIQTALSCTCDVTFSPTSFGAKSATLEIPSNDPDTSLLIVPLRSGTASPAVVPCEGDFDGDGDVDGSDIAFFSSDYGCTGDCEGDLNEDHIVDAIDLAALAVRFGRTECSIGFFEDFNDGVADNWYDPDSGEWSVADGVYKLTGSSPSPDICRHSYYDQVFSDFAYRVRLNRIQGSLTLGAGITFRSNGTWQNGYRLIIAEASDFGYYRIIKYVDGTSIPLTDWKMSTAIKPGYGVWNTLKVICVGSSLEFYVNGTHVESLDDSTFLSGQVGLMAWDLSEGDNTVIHFDDAHLTELR